MEEIITQLKEYILEVTSEKGWIYADSETVRFFGHKGEIKKAPPPPIQPNVKTVSTVSIKTTAPASKPPVEMPTPPPKPVPAPSSKQALALEPLQANALDIDAVKASMKTLCPHIRFIEEPLAMIQKKVAFFIYEANQAEIDFLNKVAAALTERGREGVIIDSPPDTWPQIWNRSDWDLVLTPRSFFKKHPSLKESYRSQDGAHYLGSSPFFPLEEISMYLNDLEKKKEMWVKLRKTLNLS